MNSHSIKIILFGSFFDCSAPPKKKERLVLALPIQEDGNRRLVQPRKKWEFLGIGWDFISYAILFRFEFHFIGFPAFRVRTHLYFLNVLGLS